MLHAHIPESCIYIYTLYMYMKHMDTFLFNCKHTKAITHWCWWLLMGQHHGCHGVSRIFCWHLCGVFWICNAGIGPYFKCLKLNSFRTDHQKPNSFWFWPSKSSFENRGKWRSTEINVYVDCVFEIASWTVASLFPWVACFTVNFCSIYDSKNAPFGSKSR